MRFGLFYEHQLPRPWPEGAEERLLNEALEQIELADRLGFDYVWEVEHHFLEEYSHSSAPEVFLAAASQRTRRIRLGHGIVQIPPAYNHPARVAERIATLDLISGGRVEFGTGESASQSELGGFGIDRNLKHAQWEEALDAITRMLAEEPFAGYDGRFIKMPPRNIVPRPKQKPHPPLWVACSRRETIRTAARRGLGALSFSFIEPEEAKVWVDEYYRLIASEECVPGGFSVNPNVAVVVPFMCHEDERTAIERGIDGAHFFGYSLAHYYVFGKHQPGRTNIWEEFLANRDQYGFARWIVRAADAPLAVKLLQEGFGSLRGAIGTPEQIADLIARYERAGVDAVIFVSQAGRNRHEHICESLELFARAVMPRFAANPGRRLTEVCERALKRRSPPRDARAPYVITSQGETGSTAGGVLGKLSDSRLETLLGFRAVQWLIFHDMARKINRNGAAGLFGDIQYELEGRGRIHYWMISLNGTAAAAAVKSPHPAVTMRARLADFGRIGLGQMNAGEAMLTGKLRVHGDAKLLAQFTGALVRGSTSPR